MINQNNSQNSNTEDKILDQIKEGKIKMKPRAYFVAKAVLFVLGIAVILLFLIYLASFIVFSLRVSGMLFLPIFTFLGVRILFGSLPWLLIFLIIFLIILLEVFAKHAPFIYKKSAIYSLVIIIFTVLIIGLVVGFSPFHLRLFNDTRSGRLQLIGAFYNDYGVPKFGKIHNGYISELTNEGLTIETPNQEILSVLVSDKMKEKLNKDDLIFVVGERKNDTVKAIMLKKINENDDFFPLRKKRSKPFRLK